MKMRLVAAETVNFTLSEESNLEAELKKKKLHLGPGECVVFFSMTGRQAMFVRGPTTLELQAGTRRTLLVSVRLRLDGGTWWQSLPRFFKACEEFGIDVVGLQRIVYDYAAGIDKHVERQLRATG